MTQLGSIIVVDVDPDGNDGLEQAAAIVTGVFENGSLRVRVLGADATKDTVRNHVDEHGEPYSSDDDEAAPADDAEQLLAKMSPEERDKLRRILEERAG